METTKISFGFKLAAKPKVLPVKQKEAPKVVKELIKCLEGQEILLVNEKKEEAALVIPMQGNQKTSTALASLMKRRAVLLGEDENNEKTEEPTQPKVEAETITNENLEQRAARELLAQLQPNGENVEQVKLVLPALTADELPLDGAKESTIDDYESIPIQQFGFAMLRGMGWVEPPKKKEGAPLDDAPMLRPKGMGLGADKALKPKPLLVKPAANEVLEVKKLAYVRILGGKHKDAYGQIEGFDDHAGRVIVKMAIGGAKEAFNEFMCQPVTKKEFTDYGKCINTAKYEEYKKLERNEQGQLMKKADTPDTSRSSKTSSDRERHSEKYERLKIKEESANKGADDRNYKKERRDYKDYKDDRPDYKDYKNERRDYKDYKDERTDYKYHKNEFASSSRQNERASNYNNEKETNRRQNDIKTSDRSLDVYKNSSNRNYDEQNRNNERRSRTPTRHHKEHSASNSRRRSTIEESDDASDSTQSDSDSAYERKHKKKSSGKSKRHKSKKSKSKSRRRANSSSSDEDDKSPARNSDNERKHRNAKHKKKTKKSKHARSRTRSRSRGRR